MEYRNILVGPSWVVEIAQDSKVDTFYWEQQADEVEEVTRSERKWRFNKAGGLFVAAWLFGVAVCSAAVLYL